jgi:hypothetical protein
MVKISSVFSGRLPTRTRYAHTKKGQLMLKSTALARAAALPVFAATALLLAGCGGTGAKADSSSSPTVSSNREVCANFAQAHNELALLMTNGKGTSSIAQHAKDEADQVKAMDTASLRAEGSVRERMNTAVSVIPADPTDMLLTDGWRVGEKYLQAVERVGTACGAEGFSAELATLPLAPEFLRK